jgi:hypothetical protein
MDDMDDMDDIILKTAYLDYPILYLGYYYFKDVVDQTLTCLLSLILNLSLTH